MGNFLKAVGRRILEYPIKTQPICFHRQEDFTSSGMPYEREDADKFAEVEQIGASTHHPKEKSQTTKEAEENKKARVKKVSKKYPGWDEHTISYLHNLFLLFDDQKKAMLSPEDFCAILELLGEGSSFEFRITKFQEADVNGDNWLSYDEFLPAMYNFNPPSNGQLRGLAKLCFEASENIKFVSNLTIGEQLEYGLF